MKYAQLVLLLVISIQGYSHASMGNHRIPMYTVESEEVMLIASDWLYIANEFVVSNTREGGINVATVSPPHDIANETGSPYGFGTYLIKLVFPRKNISYGLNISRIKTSYRIFSNGVLIGQRGEPGKLPSTTLHSYTNNLIKLPSNTHEIVIAIQFSNFIHYKGGMDGPIQIGPWSSLEKISQQKKFFEVGTAFIFAIMGVYILFLYFMRIDERSLIWFSVFAFCISIRQFVIDSKTITIIFPSINLELMIFLDYATPFIATGAIILYSFYIFDSNPSDKSRQLSRLYIGIAIITMAIPFVAWVIGGITWLAESIFLLVPGFLVTGIIYSKASRAFRVSGQNWLGWLFLLNGSFLVLLAFRDLLIAASVIQGQYMVHFAMLGFVIGNAVLNNQNLMRDRHRIQQLVSEIEIKNLVLEEKNTKTKKALEQEVDKYQELSELYLRLSSEQTKSIENERTGISRDIHDILNSRLFTLSLELEDILGDLSEQKQKRVNKSKEELSKAYNEIREMIQGIRPSSLDHMDLKTLLEFESSKLEGVSTIIRVHDATIYLNNSAKTNIYAVFLEAKTNLLKYGGKAETFVVRVTEKKHKSEQGFSIVIEDDGEGCDISNMTIGSGIFSIQNRFLLLRGTVEISSHIKEGFTIKGWIPRESNVIE